MPRSLRTFFASTALAQGVPSHEVSGWLGHWSVKTTINIYGKPDVEDLRGAATTWDGRYGAAQGEEA